MHHAFFIDEVVREILSHLGRSDLIRVQRTSSIFLTPTVEAMWAVQESLRYLLPLLPQDVVYDGPLHLLPKISTSPRRSTLIHVGHTPPQEQAPTVEPPSVVAERTNDLANIAPLAFLPPEPAVLHIINGRGPVPVSEEGAIHGADGNLRYGNIRSLPPLENIRVLRRPITEAEIALVLRRSARIRRVQHSIDDEKAFLVFEALVQQFPQHNFFPAIQELVIVTPHSKRWGWNARPLLMWYETPRFLLPKVRKIVLRSSRSHSRSNMDTNFSDTSIGPLISGVANNTGNGNLRSLTLDSSGLLLQDRIGRNQAQKEFIRVVQVNSSSLELLSLPDAPFFPVWKKISTLSVLEELRLGEFTRANTQSQQVERHFGAPAGSITTFPTLKVLYIRERAASLLTLSALSVSSFPSLETITVRRSHSTHGHIRASQLIRIIGENSPNLRRFIIDIPVPLAKFIERRHMSAEVIKKYDLAPLMNRCPRLEHLEITSRGSIEFELDNDAVSQMATAWPCLTHLSFSTDHSPNSTINLEGLIPFARSCPSLDLLRLCVDESLVNYLFGSEMYHMMLGGDDRPWCKLRKLDIGAPWIHNTLMGAEFLTCLFPSLETLAVPARHNPSSGRIYTWNKVVGYVKEYSKTKDRFAASRSLQDIKVEEKSVARVIVDDEDDEDYYEDFEPEEYSSNEGMTGSEDEKDAGDDARLKQAIRDTGSLNIS